MSGGVDSSVAACLLHEQGYDVVGVFMRLGSHEHLPAGGDAASIAQAAQNARAADACATDACAVDKLDTSAESGRAPRTVPLPVQSAAPRGDRHRGCCSAEDATDARVVAGKLGVPFYALNFEKDFSKLIDRFADEYAVGRTPNPCVLCNSWLKFGKLRSYADAVGAEYIATGHYARLDWREDGAGMARPILRTARHTEKDQSYFLFGVSPRMLRRTLFPLGDLTKEQVRAHARRLGLAVHDKAESQDICFVPDRDYAAVVRARRPEAFVPGEIRHVDGRVLGRHDGLPQFTVGQRRGVRVAEGAPIYVTNLDASTGTLTVGPRESALTGALRASGVHWLIDRPTGPIRALVRVRYNHAAAPATVTIHAANDGIPSSGDRDRAGLGSGHGVVSGESAGGADTVIVRFDEPQWAVAPGQAAVFYDGEVVLGGGWIDSPIP